MLGTQDLEACQLLGEVRGTLLTQEEHAHHSSQEGWLPFTRLRSRHTGALVLSLDPLNAYLPRDMATQHLSLLQLV